MKVIRSEGRFPFGMASLVWPFIKYSETHRISYTRGEAGGFFGRDTDWRGIRTFLQTDLLSPQSAGGYIPGVIVAAKLASKGAPKCGDDLTSYLNRCAFDMFCTVMFGELVQVADPSTPTDPENLEFIENSVTFLNISTRLMVDPYESLAGRLLNVETNKYKQFVKATSKMMEIGRTKVKRFQKQYELGLLDEYQSRSYLAHAIKRQKEGTGDDVVTDEMMVDLCVLLLTASVDTTSGVMAWVLLHAALNPDVQEKLFEELKANLTSNKTGRLTADVLHKRSNTPYLHAVLRESHRLTPTVPNSIMKEVVSEIEIHGIVLPPKSMVSFANYAIQMDPAYFEEPEEFRPERWLPDAVEARRGTPKEVLDHPFFKDPFSQGSRKCPGSRVAINEVLCLLSQLILDYKIRAPAKVQTYKDVPYTLMGVHSPILPELEFVPRIM